MTRTGPQRIPGAVFDLFFGNGQYSGDDMEVNCAALHTTEGPNLVSYESGKSAPNVTGVPDFGAKRIVWHQHFDVDESARALVNAPGGVETNRANCFQIELVGTCDPGTHAEWTRQGMQHIFWPQAPDWALAELAWLMRWLRDNHGIPLTSGLTFKPYPASYGANNGVRMSFTQWQSFTGWLGHQHAPENLHGDPGDIDINRLLALAQGESAAQTTEEDPLAAFSRADLLAIVSEAVASVNVRDTLAYAVWEFGLPNVNGKWEENATAPTVPAKWLAAAANPLQIQLASVQAALAAQAAVLRTVLDATDSIDTATVIAAITASADKAFAEGLDIHLTTAPKES